jgi:hypothetical protein
MKPSDELLARAEELLGSRPVSWRPATGGYSIAERWTLTLADGRRVFTKRAPTEEIATFLRAEHRNLQALPYDFRCEVIAWDDTDRPLLILEDLSDARWPPPWEAGDVDRVRETLERVWDAPVPSHLPGAERMSMMFERWPAMAASPDGFLSLGLGSREWLETCAQTLADGAASASVSGADLLHLDVRSDNMCFAGDRTVLVDWNWASRGSRELDLAAWLPSLRLEGGPLPEEVGGGLGAYAAALSSFFAAQAFLPPPEGAPTVRKFQLRQLRIALPWACRELGLPQPDVMYARIEIEQLNEDLDVGRITQDEWHRRSEEVLIDAYLASDDPRGQSGKSGDETEWRWSRELVLDVFPPRATFLDVGCANGYLMESVHRWGAERGIEVEPYGLDISWRIASLAKHRLPQWADRIFVGNVIDWTPPRRFDVVQSGLDEAGSRGERELVERILREFLVPGGVLVFRPNRVGPEQPDRVQQLRAIGLEPDGVIDAVHPTNGEVRRTAYLRAPVG